jgi:hypothetical protein
VEVVASLVSMRDSPPCRLRSVGASHARGRRFETRRAHIDVPREPRAKSSDSSQGSEASSLWGIGWVHSTVRRCASCAPRPTGDRMRKGLSVVAVGFVVALTLSAPSALATGRGRASVNHRVFKAPRGLGVYYCGLADKPGTFVGVYCQSVRVRPLYQQNVTLDANGHAVLCREHGQDNHCNLGNSGEDPVPTLAYGRQIRVGRFRCQVLHTGVRCTVIATGRGFLITRDKLVPVGGATVSTPPLHLSNFLSPDRRVWCGIGEGRQPFCVAGQTPQGQGYPSASAELEGDGNVRICFIAQESEAPLLHGFPEGCAQNWDAKAPILRYGQQTELEGVLCTSATGGITCTALAGAAKGKGFRVNANEAVVVGA